MGTSIDKLEPAPTEVIRFPKEYVADHSIFHGSADSATVPVDSGKQLGINGARCDLPYHADERTMCSLY